MIQKEECYVGVCDNCGEMFSDGDYTLFPLTSDVADQMSNCDWYTGRTDPDHLGKHYCPSGTIDHWTLYLGKSPYGRITSFLKLYYE